MWIPVKDTLSFCLATLPFQSIKLNIFFIIYYKLRAIIIFCECLHATEHVITEIKQNAKQNM